MLRMKKTPLIRLAVDLAIFLATGLPLLIVHILVEPMEYGFFCDDTSIRYPQKDEAVPMEWCAVVGVSIVVVSFIAVEFTMSLGCHKTRDTRLINVVWTIAKLLMVFGYGMCVNLIITEAGKLMVGGLRPNFLAVCKPNISLDNCTHGQYIENFVCTNTDVPKKVIIDARKTFPSGHCSFAAFTAFFLSFYYQQRLKTDFTVLLKTFLQVCVTLLACHTIFSRITDHRHHYGDVMGGTLLGILVAVWTLACLGSHLDLKMGPFPARRPTSPGFETQNLPMSDPCTPEPATFLAEPPGFGKNSV